MPFHHQTQDLLEELNHPGWNLFNTARNYINSNPESNKNILHPLIPAMTGIKNFAGFPGTHETRQQQEWMKNKLLEKVRNSGSLSGTMTYDDYGSKFNPTGGIFGAPFAYSNSLGASDYSIPQQGGQVDFAKSGTAYNFEPGDIPGKIGAFVTDIVNKGGIMNMDYGNNFPNYKPEPQHYTPDITITPQDIQNIFGGGQMVHKGEPTITAPPVQPTIQPTINNVSPGGGNSRRGGSPAAAAQRAAAIARARQTTQSVVPAPKRRATATRGRTAPVMRSGPPNMQRGFRGPHR